MEWLFFATKPSFLSNYSLVEQLGALGSTPLFFLPAIFIAILVSTATYLLIPQLEFRYFSLLAIVPAGIATALTVLLIDNFTYSIFRVGIIKAHDYQNYIILTIILLIWIGWCIWFTRKIHRKYSKFYRIILTPFLVLLSLLSCVATLGFAENFEVKNEIDGSGKNLPNIIMFAADGIQASNTSTYGYHRRTTPHLDAFAKDALVVYNTVSNSGRTTGAITAMLTGKYPTTTKVMFPPHVLRGRHSYEHLPGILKKLGYKNIQESIRYYADSHDLNMHSGFDFANGRDISKTTSLLPKDIEYKLFPLIQFAQRLWQRIKNRALHLANHRPMTNAFDAVNPSANSKVYGISDQDRIDRATKFIINSEEPVFAHIHLMGPHCCRHRPKTRIYSAGHKKRNKANSIDFYDDTILEADEHFGQFLKNLRAANKYDDSLIIYSSDHTRGWRTTASVPLVMRFPNGEHAGARSGTSQLIDVAPTVVEYLEFPSQIWMEGNSLISNNFDKKRNLFTVDSVNRKKFKTPEQMLSKLVGSGPPLYGLKTINMLDCDKNYILDVETGELSPQGFDLRVENCSSTIDEEKAKTMLELHLVSRGFTLPYQ